MENYIDFAKRIKTKHPSYSSVDDLALAKKIVEKYPQYSSQVSLEPLTLAGKVSSGVKTLAEKTVMAPFEKREVMGREINPVALAEEKGTEVKKAAQDSISNMLTKPRKSILPESVPAGIAAVGSTLVESAPFTPLEFGSAAGAELAGPLVLPGVRTRVAEAIGNKFLNTPLKVLKKDFEKGVQSQGLNLIKNNNLTGSRTEVFSKTLGEIDRLEGEITRTIANAPKDKLIDKFDVAATLDNLVDEYKKSGVSSKEIRQIMRVQDEYLNNLPDKFAVDFANQNKRAIYRKVGDKGYLSQAPTARVEAERTLASALRQEIEKIVPSIKQLNTKQGEFLGIRDSLLSAIPSESKNLVSSTIGGFTDSASVRLGRNILAEPSGGGVLGTSLTELSARNVKEKNTRKTK